MTGAYRRVSRIFRQRRGKDPNIVRLRHGLFICAFVGLTSATALAQTSVYAIEGLALGANVDPGRPAFRGYQCSRSEQFAEFTRCERNQRDFRRPGATSSLLYGRDGKAQYINYSVSSLLFDRNGIQNEIGRLSSKFGERGREIRLPQREGLPNAVIASWGKIELELLEPDAMAILASGESPRKGLLIDYLGNLRRSAQLGLPVFSLTGGAGYILSASSDRYGRGHMRFITADPSALAPVPATASPPAETAATEKVAADKRAAEKTNVDTELASGEPEKKVELELASAEPAGLTLPAETHADGSVARLEASLAAAQAHSHAMETLAYRAIAALILVLLAVSSFLIWRARGASKRRALVVSAAAAAVPAQTAGTCSEFPAQNNAALVEKAAAPQQLLVASGAKCASDQPQEQSDVQQEHKGEPSPIIIGNEVLIGNGDSAGAVGALACKPCARCNGEISIEDKFCMHCGAATFAQESASKTRVCPSCSIEVGALDRFCRHCGASSLTAVVAPSLQLGAEPA
ncbi:MAG TPA: zinc ribbon domain-containing protein [Xanthobacteraceae bacterium]